MLLSIIDDKLDSARSVSYDYCWMELIYCT